MKRPNFCRECSHWVDRITWGVVREQERLGATMGETRTAVAWRLQTESVAEAEEGTSLCASHRGAPEDRRHWTETD